MEKTQAEASYSTMMDSNEIDLSLPIKTLFDECLNYISLNDLSM